MRTGQRLGQPAGVFTRLYPLLLAGAAVLLMMWSADNFRPFRLAFIPRGFALLFIGGVVLLAALYARRAGWRFPQTERAYSHLIGEHLGLSAYLKIGIGLLALLFLTLINVTPPLVSPTQVSIHIQMALFAVGVSLLTWGLSGSRIALPKTIPLETWAIILITTISLVLGLWQLETAVHTFIDEFHTLEAVNQLATRNDIALLMPYSGSAFFPWIYPYLQLGPLFILGHTLSALRIVSVMLGTLTVPGLYVLAKNLFDRPTALIAALFLATFPPHIHFSRLSLINVVDPFLGTWALAFLARGIRSSKRLDFVLAGLCLGLTQYFYEGGKLLYPALAGLWFVMIVLFRRKQASIHGFALTLMVALLIAAPLYVTWASWQLPFAPRMAEVGDSQLNWRAIITLNNGGLALREYLERNVLPPLLHIIQRVDTSNFYYGGETPLILGYLLPAFFLGLFHALWRWRIAGILPLLWLVLAIVGNSLLTPLENTWSARYLVMFSALVLLIAVGFRFTIPLLFAGAVPEPDNLPLKRTTGSQVVYAFICGVIVVMALLQPVYYFGYHIPYYNQQIRRDSLDHIDLFYRARSLPRGTTLIAVTERDVYQHQYDVLRTFWDFDATVAVIAPADFTVDYLTALPTGAYAFFLEPENDTALNLLQSRFPDVVGPLFSPYNLPLANQYVLYSIAG